MSNLGLSNNFDSIDVPLAYLMELYAFVCVRMLSFFGFSETYIRIMNATVLRVVLLPLTRVIVELSL